MKLRGREIRHGYAGDLLLVAWGDVSRALSGLPEEGDPGFLPWNAFDALLDGAGTVEMRDWYALEVRPLA